MRRLDAGGQPWPDLSAPWPGRDLADAAHHLQRTLQPTLARMRDEATAPEPEALEAVLRRVLRRSAGTELPTLVAAYRRGEVSRSQLYRSPAFGAAVREEYADLLG